MHSSKMNSKLTISQLTNITQQNFVYWIYFCHRYECVCVCTVWCVQQSKYVKLKSQVALCGSTWEHVRKLAKTCIYCMSENRNFVAKKFTPFRVDSSSFPSTRFPTAHYLSAHFDQSAHPTNKWHEKKDKV